MARLDYFNDSNAPKPNSIVPSASAIVTNDEGKILLHRRSDNDLWAVPGGAMDIGESIGETVVREVKEETGFDVVVRWLAGIYVNAGRRKIAFSFVCKVAGGKKKTSDESDAVKYFEFEHIPRYTYPYHVARIKDVLDKPGRIHLKLEHGPSPKKLLKQGKL